MAVQVQVLLRTPIKFAVGVCGGQGEGRDGEKLMGYKVVHLVGGASPFVTIEDAVNKYVDEGWRLVAVSQGLHYFERNDGPSGRPPRYWGIYDTRTNAWLRKSNGEPYHFPAPGVAQALLDTLLVDMAHTVDGRGRLVSESLAVKEMVYDGPTS